MLAAVLVAGAVLRQWIMTHTSGLTMDSPLYVEMAGQLGHALQPLGPAHHGYPALVSVASLVIPGREMPGRLVSFTAGLLLIVVTFLLARRALPAWGAAVAAALVAGHPLLALSSCTVMTESSFQTLTYSALLVLEMGRTALAGALLGLSYCIRPEAMVIAFAALPALAPARRRWVWILTFVLAALPEVALLSIERGTLTVTPKTNLVAAAGAASDDSEWQTATTESLAAERARPPLERIGRTLAAAARRYPDRLSGQLLRMDQTWPAPLAALSVIGAIVRPGLLLAPFAILLVLPMLGVTPHLRYPQTMVPALAVYAAIGAARSAAWAATRSRGMRASVIVALALALCGGLVWCWRGPAGDSVRRPEDAAIPSLRRAGQWLAMHGRPGALVMDRKPYLPFFAGMRQALMPNDDYDTIVRYAIRTGVDYLAIEELVMWKMRPQFIPLMTDSAFRAREDRLRLIYGVTDAPGTGIAIFEITPKRE